MYRYCNSFQNTSLYNLLILACIQVFESTNKYASFGMVCEKIYNISRVSNINNSYAERW